MGLSGKAGRWSIVLDNTPQPRNDLKSNVKPYVTRIDNPRYIVIGAGIGGLSAAVHLAAAGRRVLILEQAKTVGGKMGEMHVGGYRWDTGPSVITMRHVLDDLFAIAGRDMAHYLNLHPVEPLTRYFYPDGTVLDISRDVARTLAQIQKIEARDVEGYLQFLAYAARLYRVVSPVFIYDQPPRLGSLLKGSPLDTLRIDGVRSMRQAILYARRICANC